MLINHDDILINKLMMDMSQKRLLWVVAGKYIFITQRGIGFLTDWFADKIKMN